MRTYPYGVTRAIRDAVFARDKGCVLARLLPDTHECRNMWGRPMLPTDTQVGALTLEHVKSDLAMGKRAPSDMAHLVVLCYGSNIGVPSKYERGLMRSYLQTVNARDAA